MKPYPIKLIPVLKFPIWGGRRLKTDWCVQTDAPTVGESWVLTLRKQEKNVIANGVWAGRKLEEVIKTFGASADDFPLLVKLLDAGDTLSVQVHPDDRYAAEKEHDRGKTEMWHVIEADPGAELIMGLKPGITPEDFAKAVRSGKIEDALSHIPVKPGETYFIPAGMPHAIGKGILLAEIQQNCDLTYRIYDFNRLGADGKPRDLHIQKALDVVRPFSKDEVDHIQYENDPTADRNTVLADCSRFRVERHDVSEIMKLSAIPKYRHLLCIKGEGRLVAEKISYPIQKADSYLLPPSQDYTIQGNLTFLLTDPPEMSY